MGLGVLVGNGYYQGGRVQHAAVVGTRPMRVYQPNLERLRMTKFMLRYVGQVVCGRPRSDGQSVMFTPVMSTADLGSHAADGGWLAKT
jgi:hypothetical protein